MSFRAGFGEMFCCVSISNDEISKFRMCHILKEIGSVVFMIEYYNFICPGHQSPRHAIFSLILASMARARRAE